MKLPITDVLAERLGLYVESFESDCIVVRTDTENIFYNAYGFAHGGFLYTMGHITARNMGKLCLDRHMQVVQSDCLYLKKVYGTPVRARASLLTDYGHTVVCLAEVLDAKGEVCFRQTLTMQDTVRDRVILSEPKAAPVMDASHGSKAAFAQRVQEDPFFDDLCHISSPEYRDGVVVSSTDLYEDIVSDCGYVHQGALFTCCDNCAAACVAMLQKKRPITIASTVHYLSPATIGPVTAEGRLIREGKDLSFYKIDVFDGYGKPVVTTQFVMQTLPFPNHVKL